MPKVPIVCRNQRNDPLQFFGLGGASCDGGVYWVLPWVPEIRVAGTQSYTRDLNKSEVSRIKA